MNPKQILPTHNNTNRHRDRNHYFKRTNIFCLSLKAGTAHTKAAAETSRNRPIRTRGSRNQTEPRPLLSLAKKVKYWSKPPAVILVYRYWIGINLPLSISTPSTLLYPAPSCDLCLQWKQWERWCFPFRLSHLKHWPQKICPAK